MRKTPTPCTCTPRSFPSSNQALAQEPDAVGTLELLASALERSGYIELAEERLSDAMQPAVVLKYADFLRRRGALERADDLLTRATAQRPNDMALLSNSTRSCGQQILSLSPYGVMPARIVEMEIVVAVVPRQRYKPFCWQASRIQLL
jgi:hypothetical protein